MTEKQVQMTEPFSLRVQKWSFKIFVGIFLGIILVVTYFPILVIALTSISTHPSGYEMPGVTFRWYGMLIHNRELFQAILFTLRITLCSTVISTLFGTLTAVGINALNSKWRKRMIILNNIPILNADIVTAVLLLIVFQTFSIFIHVNVIARYSEITTLIAHVLFSTPYVVLSVLPKLNKDQGLFDAAMDLGCSPKSALWKVILPNIRSGIFSGALLAFTMSIDDFIITYFVSSSNQNFSTWLYGNLKMMKNGQWNQACAYNTLLILITFSAIIIYQIFQSKKESRRRK